MNQVNTKAAILRQFEKHDVTLRAQEEIDRMKELVSRLSTHKLRVRNFKCCHLFFDAIDISVQNASENGCVFYFSPKTSTNEMISTRQYVFTV